MPRIPSLLVVVVAVLAISIAPSAFALVIRHDTATLDYENYGKQPEFIAATNIVRGNDTDYGISGATAIDSRWGVHARHTLRHVDTWMDAGNGAKLRGRKWTGWNNQGLANVNVVEVIHFDDDFTRFANAIDIAVVRTDAASSARRIAPLYGGWDEVGQVGSGISGANNRIDGNGNSRKPENEATSNSGRPWEVLWGGKNDINQVNTQSLGSPANALLKMDLDHPTDTSKSIMGGNTAIDLEYGSANGDSGSPVYVDKAGVAGQIVGVLSGGSGNSYGSSVVYVRTRPYLNWIADTILANPDDRTLSLSSIPDQFVAVGETLEVTASASGSEQPPLTVSYRLVNPPVGASIDEESGVVTWTPPGFFAGTVQTITVEAFEDGEVGNSVTTSFDVSGEGDVAFWDWSGAPTGWGGLTVGGGGPYALNSANFPYLQGDANNQIYQQVAGTIPIWATVTVQIKLADFHQTWSKGGEIEYGFRTTQPTAATAGDDLSWSAVAQVPNYDSATGLADGLGNTGGNVDHFFAFTTDAAISDPWFVVRKLADGNRFAVDDIAVGYYFEDSDQDGLPNAQEVSIGTDPNLADSDADGLDDGADPDPLDPDIDADGYVDGHDSDPLDPNLPGGPDIVGIGINFVAVGGPAGGTALPVNAYGGLPTVAQKNWNQTAPISGQSGGTGSIATPVADVLVDSQGDTTETTLAFTMANMWSINNEDVTPFGRLFAGYLDTNANRNATVTLSGIPYESYDAYVYLGSDVNGRTGKITDGSTTYSFTTAAKSGTAGSYIRTQDTASNYPSANYAVFTGLRGENLSLTYLRQVGNGGIQGVQIISTSIPSPYELWASSFGLDAGTDGQPSADADLDGVPNLTEFVLNSNPSDPGSAPEISIANDGTLLSMTFTVAKAAAEASVIPKQSDDLENWSANGVSVNLIGEDAETRTYNATVPTTGGERAYLRLELTMPVE